MTKNQKKSQYVGKKEELTKEVSVNKQEEKKVPNSWIWGGVAVIIVAALAFSQWCCPEKKINFTPRGKVDDGIVVAIIDGEKLRMTDLEVIKDGIPQLKDIPMETVYNNLLEGYVNSRVVLKAAEKSGIKDRADVQKAINDAKEQILSKAYLAEQLQARMTPEKAKAIYDEELKNFVPQIIFARFF